MATDNSTANKFTPEVHKVWINACKEEVSKGNRPTAYLNSTGVQNVREKIWDRMNIHFTRKQISNHWTHTKKDWNTWHALLNSTGVGYDDTTRKIVMDDTWWTEMNQRFPGSCKFRKGPLLHVDDLDFIFSKMLAVRGIPGDEGGGGGVPMEELPTDPSNDFGDGMATPTLSTPRYYSSRTGPSRRQAKKQRSSGSISLDDVVEAVSNARTRSVEKGVQEMNQLLASLEAMGVSQDSPEYMKASLLFGDPFYRVVFANLTTLQTKLAWINFTWNCISK